MNYSRITKIRPEIRAENGEASKISFVTEKTRQMNGMLVREKEGEEVVCFFNKDE